MRRHTAPGCNGPLHPGCAFKAPYNWLCLEGALQLAVLSTSAPSECAPSHARRLVRDERRSLAPDAIRERMCYKYTLNNMIHSRNLHCLMFATSQA